MTVAELIAALSRYNGSMRVTVQGYEGGYNDVSIIDTIPLKLNQNDKWYFGRHEIARSMRDADEEAVILK